MSWSSWYCWIFYVLQCCKTLNQELKIGEYWQKHEMKMLIIKTSLFNVDYHFPIDRDLSGKKIFVLKIWILALCSNISHEYALAQIAS